MRIASGDHGESSDHKFGNGVGLTQQRSRCQATTGWTHTNKKQKVGTLCCRATLLNPSVMSEFKGALAENLVAISLCRTYGIEPCYWASGEKAEVDFLIESAGQIFPLEVKAGKSVAGKSLSVYARKFDPSLTIRLSGLNLKKDDRLLNVPLALVDWLPKFIEMAL